MKIHAFIFNWRGQYEKAKDKEKKLKDLGMKVIVINSDDNHRENHWVNIGEQAYFTEQFLTALKLFDGDILFHIQADASYDDWMRLIDDALKYQQHYKWGLYAPNVDHTWYIAERTDVAFAEFKQHTNLKMVGCTDCTCWFIHKDVIDYFKQRKFDFESNKYGWAFDILMSACSFTLKRPVIRDYAHNIVHPKGTNYNSEQAEIEMIKLFNSLDDDMKLAFSRIRGDREQLINYFINGK